jgi:hypothetical protein
MRILTHALTALTLLIACGATTTSFAQAFNQDPVSADQTLYEPQVDIRNGGVLEESYGYHQQGGERHSYRHGPYPPANGWYGYGFPVSTYRWGWFGAERYYPRVGWRSNYNGDCVRFAYRYGY